MNSFHIPDVGEEIPALNTGAVTRQLLVEWCAAENDYYPLHYDSKLADSMGLPGTPIQGTYKYALMGQLLQRWLGSNGHIHTVNVKYRGLDLEGDMLTARARVTEREGQHVTLEVWVECDGRRSTEGIATVVLDASLPKS